MVSSELSLSKDSAYSSLVFFFNDTATPEISTLSLHDALPISSPGPPSMPSSPSPPPRSSLPGPPSIESLSAPPTATSSDRKSTRLNSSHANISYAVFCLKKKNIPAPVLRLRLISIPFHVHLHL